MSSCVCAVRGPSQAEGEKRSLRISDGFGRSLDPKKWNPGDDLGRGCVGVRGAGEGRRHVEITHCRRDSRPSRAPERSPRTSHLRSAKSGGTETWRHDEGAGSRLRGNRILLYER